MKDVVTCRYCGKKFENKGSNPLICLDLKCIKQANADGLWEQLRLEREAKFKKYYE